MDFHNTALFPLTSPIVYNENGLINAENDLAIGSKVFYSFPNIPYRQALLAQAALTDGPDVYNSLVNLKWLLVEEKGFPSVDVKAMLSLGFNDSPVLANFLLSRGIAEKLEVSPNVAKVINCSSASCIYYTRAFFIDFGYIDNARWLWRV